MNDKIKVNRLDQSCAPTDNLQSNWDRIDCTKAEQAVKKLQARIVKAQKEGRHASTLSYGIGACIRNYSRYTFIRLPQGTLLYGCGTTMPQYSPKGLFARMDFVG